MDGRGQTTSYHYDADDRLATVGDLPAIAYPTGPAVEIVRDADGLLTSLTDASGTTTATYYPSGWLKTLTNGAAKTVTYEYNHVGAVSKLLAPDTSKWFAYSYTNRNQLGSVVDQDSTTRSSFTYDNGGRLDLLTRPGSYIDYSYNARNWITGVLNRKTNNTTLYDVDLRVLRHGCPTPMSGTTPATRWCGWGSAGAPPTRRPTAMTTWGDCSQRVAPRAPTA